MILCDFILTLTSLTQTLSPGFSEISSALEASNWYRALAFLESPLGFQVPEEGGGGAADLVETVKEIDSSTETC